MCNRSPEETPLIPMLLEIASRLIQKIDSFSYPPLFIFANFAGDVFSPLNLLKGLDQSQPLLTFGISSPIIIFIKNKFVNRMVMCVEIIK